jgi:Ca-activated chloride channel family protein
LGGIVVSVALGSPLWLAAVALLPVWWLWLRPSRADGLVVAFADDHQGPHGSPRRMQTVDHIPCLLRVLSVGCLIVALAQPRLVRVLEEPVTEGVGIAIALDLSTSMWAQDMARGQSRLDVAKSTVRTFLAQRTDDVGLVSFAGEALTRVPLTDDGYVVDAAVQGLEVGLLIDGTDIAGAIAAGASLLKDAPHRSKVLILVTDGAHNKAGLVPALAARAAAAFDVRVFAIAIGQQPANASAGIETVLTQAARITDGQYFRAGDVAALEAVYDEIDRLTLPSEQMVERIETEPLEWWLLLGALASAVAVVVLRGSPLGVVP